MQFAAVGSERIADAGCALRTDWFGSQNDLLLPLQRLASVTYRFIPALYPLSSSDLMGEGLI
jgi:hypothetical protein